MQTSVETKPGLKLRGTTCSTEVVVVRPAAGAVQLTCCGAPLTTEETGIAPSGPVPMSRLLQLGMTLVSGRAAAAPRINSRHRCRTSALFLTGTTAVILTSDS